MSRGAGRAALLVAVLVAAGAASPAAAGNGRCAAGETVLRYDGGLPHTTQRLAAGGPLKVVAIGSSSTAGAGATRPDRAYPARLQAELRARFPGTTVSVLNKGRNGDRVDNMIARFAKDVAAEAPDLVIWQLGTNSAFGRADVDAFGRSMREGLRALRALGADVIVMSQQYAPRFNQMPHHESYVAAVDRIAAAERVPLFPRYEIMRGWLSAGHFTVASMLSPDGLHLNDASYGCVAALLADAIVTEVRR